MSLLEWLDGDGFVWLLLAAWLAAGLLGVRDLRRRWRRVLSDHPDTVSGRTTRGGDRRPGTPGKDAPS